MCEPESFLGSSERDIADDPSRTHVVDTGSITRLCMMIIHVVINSRSPEVRNMPVRILLFYHSHALQFTGPRSVACFPVKSSLVGESDGSESSPLEQRNDQESSYRPISSDKRLWPLGLITVGSSLRRDR